MATAETACVYAHRHEQMSQTQVLSFVQAPEYPIISLIQIQQAHANWLKCVKYKIFTVLLSEYFVDHTSQLIYFV